MRLVRFVGPALFVAGIAALAVAFLQGQATLNLFIIFPVVTATGGWAVLGILLLVAGFFLFFITWPMGAAVPPPLAETAVPPPPAPGTPSAAAGRPPSRRWGGVVFIGPVPVVFGSDPKVTWWMLVLGVLLFVALVVLTVIALRGI